jgi:hypothetical protein
VYLCYVIMNSSKATNSKNTLKISRPCHFNTSRSFDIMLNKASICRRRLASKLAYMTLWSNTNLVQNEHSSINQYLTVKIPKNLQKSLGPKLYVYIFWTKLILDQCDTLPLKLTEKREKKKRMNLIIAITCFYVELSVFLANMNKFFFCCEMTSKVEFWQIKIIIQFL